MVKVSLSCALAITSLEKVSHSVAFSGRKVTFVRGKYLAMSSYGGRGRGGGGRGGRGGGRGEYYKNKYGGRGRGRSGGDVSRGDQYEQQRGNGGGSMDDLRRCLQRIDGKQYGAYHDLDTPANRGWENHNAGYTLYVERAQSDSFAPPTRCRVVVRASVAKFPHELYSNKARGIALGDFLLRQIFESCKNLGADSPLHGQGWSGPKGGDIRILEPCQHVLAQTGCYVNGATGDVIAQLTINLPARGRTILGQEAEEILCRTLPYLVERNLYYSMIDQFKLKQHVESVEDQCWLQSQLESRNLVSFVRNGAILPRLSGADDRPMPSSDALAFNSPQRLEVSFTLPNSGAVISGLGFPKGVTLICGGGFHGKSTLLSALQVGVYPKVPGDGREFCVTSQNASKIRAEDGRQVKAVDISPFINNLPFGKDTKCFDTLDASGSTSQAANIIESIEMGADTLLIDEDTCASNAMIRDRKMMQLVASDKEPITPFLHVVRSLYDDKGISSVLVIGGAGDYFDKADTVVMMDCYKCMDVTERAKAIVANNPPQPGDETSNSVPFRSFRPRHVIGNAFSANGKVKVVSRGVVTYGDTELDLSALEQIVSKSQTTAISNALQRLPSVALDARRTLAETVWEIEKIIDEQGLDALAPNQFQGAMSKPRRFEIAGAINRLRRDQSVVQNP